MVNEFNGERQRFWDIGSGIVCSPLIRLNDWTMAHLILVATVTIYATVNIMIAETQNLILKEAIRNGIPIGICPVCKTGLMPSSRVSFAKVPNMNDSAISFDCPNSEEHIEAPDLDTYFISRDGHNFCRNQSWSSNGISKIAKWFFLNLNLILNIDIKWFWKTI